MIAVLADRLEIAQLIFKKAQKSALPPPPHPPAAAESEAESYLEVKDKGGRTAVHCAAHKVISLPRPDLFPFTAKFSTFYETLTHISCDSWFSFS